MRDTTPLDSTKTGLDQDQRLARRRLWLPSLGLRVSERKLMLALVDTLLLGLSLTLSLLIRTDLITGLDAFLFNIKWFITLIALWAAMAAIFDVYDLARAANTAYGSWAVTGAVSLTSIVYLAIPWLTPPLLNRSQGFIFVFTAVITVSAWRVVYSRLFVQPAFQRRALVIGAGNGATTLVRAVMNLDYKEDANPFSGTGLELVGFIDDDPGRQGKAIEGIPVLGGSSSLVDLVKAEEIDELVIAISDSRTIGPELFEAILDCREIGLPVTSLTTIYERLTGRVAFQHASRNVELATGQADSPFLRLFGFVKRIIDVVGAMLGLGLLILLIPFVTLANAMTSRGPLFFRQSRVGRGGTEFELIKFRSMVPGAEANSGPVWASQGDERVTVAGKWLRLSHMDELPQVINVLKGEMSLVGPRPERPEFAAKLAESIPFYRARHSLRPGITGWAQIHQDYGDSLEDAREKLGYDLYYLKRVGPMLDTVIVLRTVSRVLGFRGR